MGDAPADVLRAYQVLTGLSSHSFSAMRELFGPPRGVAAARQHGGETVVVMFDYGHFTALYEAVIRDVAEFDAGIEVLTLNQHFRLNYDTPYVRNLPTRLTITTSGDTTTGTEIIGPFYEDPFRVELDAFHDAVAAGRPHKTTLEDSLADLRLFAEVARAAFDEPVIRPPRSVCEISAARGCYGRTRPRRKPRAPKGRTRMKRRAFMLSTGGAAAGMLLLPRLALAEAGRIDWYTALGPEHPRLLDQRRASRRSRPPIPASPSTSSTPATTPATSPSPSAPLAALADQRRSAGRLLRDLRPAPAGPARIEAGLFVNIKEAGLSNYVEDQPARHRHRLLGALPRQPGAARLRHHQARPGRRAEDLRRPRRLDQGEPRPVHLQPSRQGRLGRQLRPPRHLRGQRQGPGQVHRRQLHRRRPARRRSTPAWDDPQGPRAARCSTRAPTPRATPSRSSCSASRRSP